MTPQETMMTKKTNLIAPRHDVRTSGLLT